MNYAFHTDEELLRHANIEFNALTSTHLECILVGRFETLLADKALGDFAVEILDEFDMGASNTREIESLRAALQFAKDFDDLAWVREIMEQITESGIDTAKDLKARLERADQIDAIAEDTADAVKTLNQFFNPAPATL